MPRRFFKKISPSPQKLIEQSQFLWLKQTVKKPGVWEYTRTNITRAVFIGLFWSMIPMPLQMLAAALTAYFFSANIPVSIALVWITNPFTMPIIFCLQFLLGNLILEGTIDIYAAEISWQWVKHNLQKIGPPFLLGAAISAVILPIIGAFTVNRLWIWKVQRWQKNKRDKNT